MLPWTLGPWDLAYLSLPPLMAEHTLIDTDSSFEAFDLDPRLLRALAKLNFSNPTLIQSNAIPLALSGKDILARARTGSGKTAAYCLPVVQKILVAKEYMQVANETKRRQCLHVCFRSPQSLDASNPSRQGTRSLILVPTRELAEQVTSHLNSLLLYCSADVKAANLASNVPLQLQQPILADFPDIVVATPSRALAHLEAQNLVIRETLETLVIDEADLVLSYGYDEDLLDVCNFDEGMALYQCLQLFPSGFRDRLYSKLASFPFGCHVHQDVESLKQLILRNPALLKLEEEKDEPDLLTQYVARCSEKEKFLLTTLLLKLHLIKGKALFFVNDIDRCYRLKLYFEQFGIKSCVLNSELPLNSRYHIVQEFNKGIYDYIIATDEGEIKGEQDSSDEEMESIDEAAEIENPMEEKDGGNDNEGDEDSGVEKAAKNKKRKTELPSNSQNKHKKAKRPRQDKEYGVARGVDFQGVAAVINFDFPTSAKSYTHRVGRTARGGQRGLSISFVVPKTEMEGKAMDAKVPGWNDEKVFKKVEKKQAGELECHATSFRLSSPAIKCVYLSPLTPINHSHLSSFKERGASIKPYLFTKENLKNFNYRAEDALRAVTKTAVREARLKEIKTEILNSDHLKAHFEDNPRDFAFLRHDKPLHPTRVQSHMKHFPSYLMPKITPPTGGADNVVDSGQIGAVSTDSQDMGHINFRKTDHRRRGTGRQGQGQKVSCIGCVDFLVRKNT
ncbi:P-loop containing nucleoside triphosphate hydrolase protein [Jimgerdemannia flammicorona]|uniref:RNA helicase n=1 Tax=Jimgerdemannia flammicorona TaxID=994334 RepID=A0A433D7A3_9FUNG|nr:P-loop containing nucleoside triphosphate hydrolase protein [Jimgerdemannia flammicorona]